LLKRETLSEATRGITAEIPRLFTGPYIVCKLIPPNTYELMDDKGWVKGHFNLKSLKAYKQATHSSSWVSGDMKDFDIRGVSGK
jgi:hypothetical protein